MIFPGSTIRLSDKDRKNLGEFIRDRVFELEAQHHEKFNQIENAWSLYEAEPEVERRTEPWDNASNVVVPLCRTWSDAIIARYFNAIFGTGRIWVGKTENEAFSEFVTPVVDFLNLAARTEVQLKPSVLAAITEMVVVGESVLMLFWHQRDRWIYVPGHGPKPEPQQVTVSRGPRVIHVPRELILWDTNWPVSEAPFVARQSLLSWNDLSLLAQTDTYDADAIDKIQHTTITGSPSGGAGVFFNKVRRSGQDKEGSVVDTGLYDIRECWVDWPTITGSTGITSPDVAGSDTHRVQLNVTINQDTGQVLRVISKPFFFPDWPFYDMYFRKRSGTASSDGVPLMTEHLQRGVSTLTNQAVDAVTLANSVVGATTNPRLLSQRMRPNKWMLVDNMGEIQEFKLSKQIVPDLTLSNYLTNLGERLVGISDPHLGQETRLGGHPSPATSTIVQLREGNKLFVLGILSIRDQLSRLGKDLATLYQQFEADEGKIVRAVGARDAAAVSQFIFPTDLPIVGNLELDLQAVNEAMNPDVERQKALLVFQVTHNFYTIVMQYLQVASNPQAPAPVKAAALRGVEGLGKTFERVLENTDVDEIESFAFRLREIQGAATQGIGNVASALGGAQPPGGPVVLPQQDLAPGLQGNGRSPGSGL